MDLVKTEAFLRELYQLSDLHITLYDRHLHCIAGNGTATLAFCATMQATPDGVSRCFRADLSAFAKAAEQKTPVFCACPYGLLDVMVPLYDGPDLLGFLFAGAALRGDTEHRHEVIARACPHLADANALPELLDALPTLSQSKLDAFAHVLQIFGEHIVNKGLFEQHGQSLGELTKRYIKRNLDQKITLAGLGLYFHCSTVTLTETFRKEFGMTIMQYVTKKRLQAAEEHLRAHLLTVGEIAERCGFGSIEYFSKVFKHHYGIAPSLWRERQALPERV